MNEQVVYLASHYLLAHQLSFIDYTGAATWSAAGSLLQDLTAASMRGEETI